MSVIQIREPMWGNGSTLAWNVRDVGSSPALGTVFTSFILPRHWDHDQDHVQAMRLYHVWLLNLPNVCICKVIVCMSVIVSSKRLTIPGR